MYLVWERTCRFHGKINEEKKTMEVNDKWYGSESEKEEASTTGEGKDMETTCHFSCRKRHSCN